MKRIKSILLVIAALLTISTSASAQFRWGIKVGMDVNKMSFDTSALESSNRTGFTGGLMTEFTVPIIGIGLDASLMYTHKGNNLKDKEDGATVKYNTDYLSIPVNLKYKFGLPVVGRLVSPFVYTGPCFSFLTSKKAVSDFFHNKTCDMSWNVGLGVQLLNHLQIGAQYGFGINDAAKVVMDDNKIEKVKNNTWTITAAYLF